MMYGCHKHRPTEQGHGGKEMVVDFILNKSKMPLHRTSRNNPICEVSLLVLVFQIP